MAQQFRSWLRDNATLVTFLVAQAFAVAFGIVSIIVYSVKLETRVHIIETRGTAFTVEHMNKQDERLTTLEAQVAKNTDSTNRIIDVMTRELNKRGDGNGNQ
jgi:cell division protein FtsL